MCFTSATYTDLSFLIIDEMPRVWLHWLKRKYPSRLQKWFTNCIYIISSVMHAFWLVLTHDLLEDRRIDDVIIKTFFLNSLLYKTNRFQVVVCLFNNRSQRTSKCGLVLTTLWRYLWSITEQTHGNLEYIC